MTACTAVYGMMWSAAKRSAAGGQTSCLARLAVRKASSSARTRSSDASPIAARQSSGTQSNNGTREHYLAVV